MRLAPRSILIAVLSTVGLLCAVGVAPALAAGTITGTVTDATTHGGAGNVEVIAYDSGGNFAAFACTAGNGTYSIPSLTAGTYKVGFASQYGFCTLVTPPNYLPQYYNGVSTLDSAANVTVTDGGTASGANANLTAGGQVTGQVTSQSTHAGLSGVEVDLYDSGQNFVTSACTASDGGYSLSALSSGSYYVGFSNGCGGGNYLAQYYSNKSSLDLANPIAVTAGSTTGSVNAALPTGGQISGTVTDKSTDAPVGNVEVDIYDSSQSFVGSTCTAGDGTYSIPGLDTGTYTVGFNSSCGAGNYLPQFYSNQTSLNSANPVSVTRGATSSSINAALVQGGQIAGTVTDATTHAAVADIGVAVYDSTGSIVGETCTAADGSYSVSQLSTGTYRVGFSSSFCGGNPNELPQYYSNQSTLSAATPVSVTSGATHTGVNVALAPGGQIVGTVTQAGTGAAVSGIEVDVYDSGGNLLTTTCSAGDGTYTVSGLATGTYYVGFNNGCGAGNYSAQFYSNQTTLLAANPVSVTAGATTSPIDASMNFGGQIAGTVTSSGGATANVEVDVYDSSHTLVSSTCTASDGTYTVAGLTAGTYYVGFNNGCGGGNLAAQFYNGKSSLSAANPVTVTAGATVSGVNATLTAGATISGTVTAANGGAALSGVEVEVYDSTDTQVDSTCTADDGTYSVPGLAAGTYYVGFNGSCGAGAYAPQFYAGQGSLASATPISLPAGGSAAPVNAAMSRNVALTVASTGTGSGTVNSSPAGISCGSTCTANFAYQSSVTLTAAPAGGSTFTGWSGGGCSGTQPCTVSMNAAQSVTAGFAAVTYSVGVSLAGSGSGSVMSSPAGIACPGACTGSFAAGSTVTLTATPVGGSTFAGWSGGGCSGAGACTVSISAAQTVTATFTTPGPPTSYPVSASLSGSGSGSVSSSPGGIACPGLCSNSFATGTSVTLTATPDSGSTFTGWSGAGCSGTGTCTVIANTAQDVQANFASVDELSVLLGGAGSGSVSSSPAGIACPGSCSHAYLKGASVTLNAVPDAGSTFTGWSGGGCSGTQTCTVSMNAAQSVTATFTPITYSLNVTITGSGSGSVSSDPAGIACPGACAQTYSSGTSVILTAVADSGSTFTGWSGGGCSGAGTCTVSMSSAGSVSAGFSENTSPPPAQYTLSIELAGSGSGRVTSSPASIDCPGACAHVYSSGSTVTLVALPAAGSNFTGWSGAACATAICTITVSSDRAVIATFAPVPVSTAPPTTVPPPPSPSPARTPAPRCTVSARSSSVLMRATRHPPRRAQQAAVGRVYVHVHCTQTVSARVTATIVAVEFVRAKHRTRRLHTLRFHTQLRATVRGDRTQTLSFLLPGGAMNALRRHARESGALVLSARNAHGQATGGVLIAHLRATS